MMGRQSDYKHKFFVTGFNLDKRIRKDHILRKIKEKIGFDFIYDEVKETYGTNGNVSIPPPVILKPMLLLFLYRVRSERGLMRKSKRGRWFKNDFSMTVDNNKKVIISIPLQ